MVKIVPTTNAIEPPFATNIVVQLAENPKGSTICFTESSEIIVSHKCEITKTLKAFNLFFPELAEKYLFNMTKDNFSHLTIDGINNLLPEQSPLVFKVMETSTSTNIIQFVSEGTVPISVDKDYLHDLTRHVPLYLVLIEHLPKEAEEYKTRMAEFIVLYEKYKIEHKQMTGSELIVTYSDPLTQIAFLNEHLDGILKYGYDVFMHKTKADSDEEIFNQYKMNLREMILGGLKRYLEEGIFYGQERFAKYPNELETTEKLKRELEY